MVAEPLPVVTLSNDRRVGYRGFLNAGGDIVGPVTGGFAGSVDCGDLNSPLDRVMR